jgi:NADH-quinone oxidoreductase subunit J
VIYCVFYFLSFLAILSGLMVVFSKNAVYSSLYLIITLFCIAGHYVLLDAQFLAAVHVIVYAGAIMVLFLYVIMLLNLNQNTESVPTNYMKFAAVICAGSLMIVLIGSLKGAESLQVAETVTGDVGLVKSLGKVMFTEFLLPFEITSLLLLAAMVGAVMLGKKDKSTNPTAQN